MRRWVAPAAAALGIGFVAVLSMSGERDRSGLAAFESKGFLARSPIGATAEVEMASPDRHRVFRRRGQTWQGASAAEAALLDGALALTRDAAPERNLTAADIEGMGLATYGLARPALIVTIRTEGAPPLRIAFGGANPLGLSRYAQVEGESGIWLVPGHLARAWEDAMGGP